MEERADAGAPEDDSDCEPTAAAGGGDYLDRDGAPLRQPGLRNHGNRPPPLRAQSLDAGRTLDGGEEFKKGEGCGKERQNSNGNPLLDDLEQVINNQ